MNFRIILILLLLLAVDFYVYFGLRFLFTPRSNAERIFTWVYWTITVVSLCIILSGMWLDWRSWPKAIRAYSLSIVIFSYLAKVLLSFFLILDDVVRLFRFSGNYVSGWFTEKPSVEQAGISRLRFLVQFGALFSAIPVVSLLYGMTGNAYRYKIRRVRLSLPDLPEAFEGFKALQISDLHVGSFLSQDPLRRAVGLINEESPDVVFFTGDLVNDRHQEALEHQELLSTIRAPHGVYSVLGNHDYGDYYPWSTIEEKEENLSRLKALHQEIGWKLLLNDHAYIDRGGERIGLVGVENWSARMNFRRYGDMQKAVAGFTPAAVNVLLSHDPSHWRAEVTSEYPYIDLTLSGHTHGFQFGVEIPGFRWSPVQYVYDEWAGLYEKGRQHLYVNRGLGFIGYPGRVGILPEITVFEFTRG